MNDIQTFQQLDKYARFNEQLGRRETWDETVDRVMSFFLDHKQMPLNAGEVDMLETAMRNMDASFAMRVVQMAGPALERCEVGAYNCSGLPIVDLFAFSEVLYVSMQGTGVSFSTERVFTSRLPRVKPQTGGKWATFVVPDTTEGWADALHYGLRCWFNGHDCVFDVSQVRPAGARLKTKGGYASGPGPLLELLEFARGLVLGAQGRQLNSLEAHRIAAKTMQIVEVGGVRRAAGLGLSDLDDPLMRDAKNGKFWETMPELSMANNSAVYNDFDLDTFNTEWANLVASGTGERGIYNRASVTGRGAHLFLPNPCGEINFRPFGFCNLTLAIIRVTDTADDIRRKVMIATIMGTMQAALTKFNYIRSEWTKNAEEERLLGVDLTGALDSLLLQNDAFLRELSEIVESTNKQWAERLNINAAAASRCIKPGGNSGVLFNTGNSVSGWFSEYGIRRVRTGKIGPMAHFLRDQGVPFNEEYNDPSKLVFDFPFKAPEGVVLRKSMSALDQLEWWLKLKLNWTDHNPSCTIYVKPEEWEPVRQWVVEHWDLVGGLAFFPYSDAVYPLAPLEEITKERYDELMTTWPKIDWSLFPDYELFDQTVVGMDKACAGGACEL